MGDAAVTRSPTPKRIHHPTPVVVGDRVVEERRSIACADISHRHRREERHQFTIVRRIQGRARSSGDSIGVNLTHGCTHTRNLCGVVPLHDGIDPAAMLMLCEVFHGKLMELNPTCLDVQNARHHSYKDVQNRDHVRSDKRELIAESSSYAQQERQWVVPQGMSLMVYMILGGESVQCVLVLLWNGRELKRRVGFRNRVILPGGRMVPSKPNVLPP
mmetsp:Transcript_56078/g.64334  ORF Transcript_56078/g.64334 Transcript_56078/m.64334 type:complete len:216 (+) Transcript_56078:1869-2516(+)